MHAIAERLQGRQRLLNVSFGSEADMASLLSSLGRGLRHTMSMNQTRAPSAFSKVSVGSRTVIPREVRERLQLRPGDTLRYRLTQNGVLLDKSPANEADDAFSTFSEWSSEADEKAYGNL